MKGVFSIDISKPEIQKEYETREGFRATDFDLFNWIWKTKTKSQSSPWNGLNENAFWIVAHMTWDECWSQIHWPRTMIQMNSFCCLTIFFFLYNCSRVNSNNLNNRIHVRKTENLLEIRMNEGCIRTKFVDGTQDAYAFVQTTQSARDMAFE